jgi:hypothetical protein
MSEESGTSDRREQIDALPEPHLRQLFVEVRDHINLRDYGPARVANDRAHDPNSLAALLEAVGEMLLARSRKEPAMYQTRTSPDSSSERELGVLRCLGAAAPRGCRNWCPNGETWQGQAAERKREAVPERNRWCWLGCCGGLDHQRQPAQNQGPRINGR